MCKVSNCDEGHAQHYCRLCKTNDVDHFAMNCPHGVDLWHGTRISSLSPISLNNGLAASGVGRLGPAVYFGSKEIAQAVAEHRGQGTGVVIICCRVYLGNIKDCGTSDDNAGSWQG
mgnify:CR=1 FL=1